MDYQPHIQIICSYRYEMVWLILTIGVINYVDETSEPYQIFKSFADI